DTSVGGLVCLWGRFCFTGVGTVALFRACLLRGPRRTRGRALSHTHPVFSFRSGPVRRARQSHPVLFPGMTESTGCVMMWCQPIQRHLQIPPTCFSVGRKGAIPSCFVGYVDVCCFGRGSGGSVCPWRGDVARSCGRCRWS